MVPSLADPFAVSGQVWWEAFAQNGQAGVAGGSSRVFARPIPLAITYASRITVRDIKVQSG